MGKGQSTKWSGLAGPFVRAYFVVSAVLTASSAIAQAPVAKRSFQSFSELRAAVLELVSGATSRVWLVSDYLTDGETVTALYIAQYRKLDVKVLLGRAKANAYMSRLNYLKNQNVPVFLKPDSFKAQSATVILADDTVMNIDGELDFLAKYKKYNVTYDGPREAEAFAQSFANAAELRVPAVARPMPLVGRAGGGRGTTFRPRQPSYHPQDGAYIYDRASAPRPAEVPNKLPKTLKFQNRVPSEAGLHQGSDESETPPPTGGDL